MHCLHRKLCYYFRKRPFVSRGCPEDRFLSLEVETRSAGTGWRCNGDSRSWHEKEKAHRLHVFFSVCFHEPSTGQRYPEEQSQSSCENQFVPSQPCCLHTPSAASLKTRDKASLAVPGQPPPAAALKGDFLCEASPGSAVIMRLPWKHTNLYDVCSGRNSSAPPTVVSCSGQSSWSRSQRLCLALSPPPVSLIHTQRDPSSF